MHSVDKMDAEVKFQERKAGNLEGGGLEGGRLTGVEKIMDWMGNDLRWW